jgi:opacity protein-like surface antigen
MKKQILLAVILFFSVGIFSEAQAQRWFKTSSLEFGILGGFSHYSGDLTQSYFETRGFKPSFGIITRYTPRELVTFRLSGQYGAIAGDDRWYEDQNDVARRNLHFKSVLWDFTGAAEINLKRMDVREKRGVYPYGFIGVSVFKYNPLAQFEYDATSPHLARVPNDYASLASRDGEWVELQPLGTEGQETTEFNERRRYNLTQLAVPVGAGLKFKLSNNWTLGVEYGVRVTFTDYLDDVSMTYVDPSRIEGQYGAMSAAMGDRSPTLHFEDDARGNPEKNDMYGILGVSFTYRIYGFRPVCPSW